MTTLAKIKSYLSITTSAYDTLLGELILNITSFISIYTERNFSGDAITELIDGGNNPVILNNYPLNTSPAVVISYNSGTQETPIWNVIDPTNYVINYSNGMIKFSGGMVTGTQNIKVVYTNDNATVSDALELLAKELVAKEFGQRKAQGRLIENIGGAEIDWTNEITPMQKSILDKYKRIIL